MSIEPEKDAERDPVEVVCFYVEEDLESLKNIIKHIKPLQREKRITFWSDMSLLGTDLRSERDSRLNTAHIILLLLSPEFIASDDCHEIEIQAMERHKRGEARVMPIILRTCGWKSTLIRDLQVLPQYEKPIDTWANKDEAFHNVVEGIRLVAEACQAEEETRRQTQERVQGRQKASLSPSELSFLPDGWVLRKQGYLEKYRQPLTQEEALFYFDGGIPDWQVALSPQIPRREKVSLLYNAIQGTYLTAPGVTVLLGGGGEGKSTMLRQVVCDVMFSETPWNLIWHEDESKGLSVDFCRKLPKDKGAWLIASDEADRVAGEVFNVVKLLREDGRKDIHFFLCCRNIDWKGVAADKLQWKSYCKFNEVYLGGLILKDAKLIIDAWSKCGSKGLARLAGCSPDEAPTMLMQKAQSELSKEDGSFLGAMFETRYPGGALDDRVLALLTRLRDYDDEFHRHLFDAYKYIVALHAEKQLILTKDLLAQILSCSTGELQQRFIGLLEREAATATRPSGSTAILPSNKYVFARHRVIAEAAVRILTKHFYIDFDGIYETLFQSAIDMFREGGTSRMPEIRKWRALPRYFFDKGKKDVAFRLAGLSLRLEPNDPLLVSAFSRLCQDDQQFQRGAEVFRDTFEKLPEKLKDSLYYHEWATAEGKAGNHAISAWLDGIALSDGMPRPRREDKYNPDDYIIIALDGMSIDFEYLFQQTCNPIFQSAWGATVQLGLSFKGTKKTANAHQRLRRSQEKCFNASVKINSLSIAIEYLQKGIIAAWEAREVELSRYIRRGSALTFADFRTPEK